VTEKETCACCGAAIPPEFDSCRAMFEAVLAREYADPACGAVHLLTVDAYVLQHPEEHGPRSNAFHLMRLCRLVEQGADPRLGSKPPRVQAKSFEADYRRFPYLKPPAQRGAFTIADVIHAGNAADHVSQVRWWAVSVWEAWAEHHAWARQAAQRH